MPIQVAALGANVAQVSPGVWHTCAVKTDRTLWCWGANTDGQLGDGTTGAPKLTPVQVASLGASVAEVSSGKHHTCARKTDGTVWCWGAAGALGLGHETPTRTPAQVSSLGASTVELSMGGYHSCARKADGTVWCWGIKSDGQVGDGVVASGPGAVSPVQVASLGTSVVKISVGHQHSCARKTNGSVWCWGLNSKGQLGDGTTTTTGTPVQVTSLDANVEDLQAGDEHNCVRKADQTVWCWGSNGSGALGVPDNSVPRTTPVQTPMVSTGVVEIAAGYDTTCVRKTDKSVWCWGGNGQGQLGIGTTNAPNVPPVRALVPCP